MAFLAPQAAFHDMLQQNGGEMPPFKVMRRGMRVGNRMLLPGEMLPQGSILVHKLRSFYEQRLISPVDETLAQRGIGRSMLVATQSLSNDTGANVGTATSASALVPVSILPVEVAQQVIPDVGASAPPVNAVEAEAVEAADAGAVEVVESAPVSTGYVPRNQRSKAKKG